MTNRGLQILARRILREQGISYSRAFGLAQKQLDERRAAEDIQAGTAPATPATTLVFLAPPDEVQGDD